ncbi:hypothetical protein [Actinomadura roseirufa]|uniref:hypothetical protein n=1 Tax=Actinomadura roseirufa TaxID=2094049 RepID=UPI0013F1560F|nr:hypothetical protein [Actinomadura roseirufa]
MNRFMDRLVERIAPKSTGSACSSGYFCNAAGHPGYWFRFCCTQTGCEWTYVGGC